MTMFRFMSDTGILPGTANDYPVRDPKELNAIALAGIIASIESDLSFASVTAAFGFAIRSPSS